VAVLEFAYQEVHEALYLGTDAQLRTNTDIINNIAEDEQDSGEQTGFETDNLTEDQGPIKEEKVEEEKVKE
jgi:hypothetical protein